MKGSSGYLSNCCCLPTLTCTSLHVVTIPVPWGHISGKSWGDEVSERKILCIHGETGVCGGGEGGRAGSKEDGMEYANCSSSFMNSCIQCSGTF